MARAGWKRVERSDSAGRCELEYLSGVRGPRANINECSTDAVDVPIRTLKQRVWSLSQGSEQNTKNET